MFKLLVLSCVLSVGLCFGFGGYSDIQPGDLHHYEDLLGLLQTNGVLTTPGKYTIQKVQTQVVAGMNIKYTLQVTGQSDTCEVVVWAKLSGENEVTSNTCSPPKSRRQFLAGGYAPVSNTLLAQKYETVLKKYEGSGELGLTLSQYDLLSIETQVVAGYNIRFTLVNHVTRKHCEVVVFEQPWTKTENIKKNDCLAGKSSRQLIDGGGLLGGWSHVDVTTPEVQECLTIAVDNVNRMSNDLHRLVESQVTAKQQVVAGMNYEVNFHVVESTCLNEQKSMGKLSDKCYADANSAMPSTAWKATCFKGLFDKTVNFNGVTMKLKNKEPSMINQLDNGLEQTLTPISSMNGGVIQMKKPPMRLFRDQISQSRSLLGDYNEPNLTLLRKRRSFDSMKQTLNNAFMNGMGGMRDHMKDMGHMKDMVGHMKDMGNMGDMMNSMPDISDRVNNMGDMMNNMPDRSDRVNKMGDMGDMMNNNMPDISDRVNNMGDMGDMMSNNVQDISDRVNNMGDMMGDLKDTMGNINNMMGHMKDVNPMKHMLGEDGHDFVKHGLEEKLLGLDSHDLVDHGLKLLRVDGHDLVKHGEKLLGGDDHDLVNHGEKLLGGDDHDLVNHGEKLLGGDDHDLVNHGEKLLGGDDHDLVNHGEKLLGGDGHDYCHPEMFVEFKMKFNKMYGSDKEEEKRFITFCDNMRTARKLQEKEQGTAVYGATKFADLTKDEFRQYVGKKWDITAKYGMKQATIPRGRAPTSFDWRDHGAVTPVKNQGSCGSCWAFSTTGNIEGQWAIKKRKLVSLSEQELVDCDKVDEGCNGGLPSQAYKEIERIGGMETETEYSYKGVDEKCFFNKTDVKVYINDSVAISSNETEIASWLASNGPISIGINAFAMQFYMGGISHPWKMFCNPKNLDHGVLIVGYGVQGTKPYWIVKNSWGPDWGEKGYYLVYRGDGVCGLNTMCTSAVVL